MDYKACWDYQELLFNQTIQQKILNRNLPITENVVTKNYLYTNYFGNMSKIHAIFLIAMQ